MYHPLVPCSSCRRHVRAGEDTCPFCAQAISDESTQPIPRSTKRLNRGAMFAFTASLAIAGCGGNDSTAPPTPPGDSAADSTGDVAKDGNTEDSTAKDTEVPDDGTMAGAYGGPPPDTGVKPDTGPDDDGGSGAKYGAPPFAP